MLWSYFSTDVKGLVEDGELLLDHAKEHTKDVSDYSYLVFPFSKAYEGFLKQLFLDLQLIKEDEYYGNEIRIGRILNPYFMKKKYSVYRKLCKHEKGGQAVSDRLWNIWKRGRNRVFHYFPHNFRKLSYDEALDIIKELMASMEEVTERCGFGEREEVESL